MKSKKTLLAIILVTALLLFTLNLALAQSSDEATVDVYSPDIAQAGTTLAVTRIFFQSNSAEELTITHVGLHYDWMEKDGFWGYTLTSPVIIKPGASQIFGEIDVQIPASVPGGNHTYYVGIDGTRSDGSTPFTWDSGPQSIQIQSNAVANPTALPTSSSGGNNNQGGTNSPVNLQGIAIAIGVAATVLVLVLVVVTLLTRKKKRKSKVQATADQPTEQQAEEGTQQQEEKAPEEQKNSDYSI